MPGKKKDKKERENQSGFDVKKAFRKSLKALLILLISLFSTIVIVIILFQFKFFRHFVIETVLKEVNKELIAKIELEDININILKGVELYHFRLLTRGDTMVYAPKVLLSVDILSLLDSKIIIKSVELNDPVVKILRSYDGTWYYDHIAKPSTDTSISEPVELDIIFKYVRINSGSFLFIDSLEAQKKQNGDFAIYFNFHDIYFLSDGLIQLKDSEFYFDVKLLKFYESFSDIRLNDFNCKVAFDNSYFSISDLNIDIGKSKLALSLYSNYPWLLFEGNEPEREKSYYSIKLTSNPINTEDISKFFDIGRYFNGSLDLNLLVNGTANTINIKTLQATNSYSKLNIKGAINNIDNVKELNYSFDIFNSYINLSELIKAIPILPNHILADINSINIHQLNVKGGIDNIGAEVHITSNFAKIVSTVEINNFQFPHYSIDLSIKDFNPSLFNVDNTVLNCTAKIRGSGFTLNEATASLEMKIFKSFYENIKVESGIISGNISNNGTITIDTFYILFDSSMIYYKEYYQKSDSYIAINGNLDIKNVNIPFYKINILANGLNIYHLTNDKAMPVSLSGQFEFEGSGFIPDSIVAHLDANISESLFIDKALFPFNFSLYLKRSDTLSRDLSMNSDFLNMRLSGNFNFSNILSLLDNQGIYLSDYINKKISSISPLVKDSSTKTIEFEKINIFAPLDVTLLAEIKNLYFIAPFIKDAKFDANMDLKMRLKVKNDNSVLTIDTVNLYYLEFDNGRTKITINPIQISGKMLMLIRDSLPYLNNFDLLAESSSQININDNSINNPRLLLKLHDDFLDFRISSRINELVDIYTNGNLFFNTSKLDFRFDTLDINYRNILNWSSVAPITGFLNSKGVELQSLKLQRKDAEEISITGTIDDQSIDSLFIDVDNLPINNIEKFIPDAKISGLESFNGKIDSLSIFINGIWDSLQIDLSLRTSPLNWKNFSIGSLLGKIRYNDNNLRGAISLINFEKGLVNNVFNAHIKSFPLNFVPKGENKDIFYGEEPIDIQIISNNLPLNYISSFIREIDNIKGSADLNIGINGYLPDKLDIEGRLQIDPTSFLLNLNNMSYLLEGDFLLSKEAVTINQLSLFNNPKDFDKGSMLVKGNISLKDFTPEDFQITIESSGLKILSDASVKAMPELYGDVIISTGPNPIRLFGNFAKPNIDGDINILKANLNMPNIIAKQSLQSNIIYNINGHNIKIEYSNSNNQNNQNNNFTDNNGTKEFAKNTGAIEIDLGIRIPNNIKIKMELGTIEELNAEISVPDKTTPLRFYLPRGSSQPKMTGELIVREGSKLKIYKTFNTSGKISFPTGQIDDPTLDLRAEYLGKTNIENKIREYKVILTVKGTKSYPIINFDYIIDGKQAIGDSSTITQDAIFLLIFGKTKSELFASEGINTDITKDISTIGISMYFSKFLSDLLGSSGFIQDTDIDFSSGSWENATVKVSGQLGGATWRIGGNVTDFYYNNEFSIEFPLPLMLHPKFLNNIILQFTRSTNTASPTSKDQKEWEIRLKFGGSW